MNFSNAIAAAQAAEQTINAKGAPSTPEGQLARQSMESRKVLAVQQRDSLVTGYRFRGQGLPGRSQRTPPPRRLDEKLKAGAEESLKRLFPRFKDADFAASAWEAAIKRARDGADNPFSPLKYEGPIEQHPVCQQVAHNHRVRQRLALKSARSWKLVRSAGLATPWTPRSSRFTGASTSLRR